jgi:hypothetical protein
MSLSITQTPAIVSLGQSPIPFTVLESDTALISSSSFQYVGELYYWTGSLTNSASAADYTIVKYPNASNVGIFDVSKIINSTLTSLLIADSSNVEYFAVDFYTQYLSSSTYITGSHVRSATYKALDGYGLMGQETIGQEIYTTTPYWPLMTDGPATQSAFIDNHGTSGVYVGSTGGTTPTKVVYTSNLGSADYAVSGTTNTSGQIATYPIAPAESGFPLSTTGLQWYTTQAYNGASALGLPIKYEINCVQKYPNVRVQWKNRFGQFDWMNFYMVSRESFSIKRMEYQPQLGTWQSSTLSYNGYDSSNKNYIVDANSSLSVNSFWVPQEQNNLFKQLLVADEIYWLYDEANSLVRPLAIKNNKITFKTGVVDHLIQYEFDFEYGQSYKLIF